MIIKIPYGTRPGEKIVSEGFFACPFCRHKRPYVKKKVVKVNYFGIISIPSSKALMEYVHCGGCLNVFSADTIESENQLRVELSESFLPIDTLFEAWQVTYKSLRCEDLLTDNPELSKINSPLIRTSADQMQKAGVAIKLNMIDDVKVHMYNILSLSNKWAEYNIENKNQHAKNNPVMDVKHSEFSTAAHYILSLLPQTTKMSDTFTVHP